MDQSERLLELERILASSSSASSGAGSSDLAEMMLGSVLTERIRATTSLLAQTRVADVDAADLVAMRLLLSDYGAAVTHLRAATRLTEGRLARAAATIKADGRRVSRALEQATRRERGRAKNQEPPTTTNHQPPTTN